MKIASKLIFMVLFFAISLSLSSCGKMSNLTAHEGSGYPHSYPRQ